MAQQHKVSKNNTKVLTENGKTSVILHTTRVVEFDDKAIVLNSGGWRTVTTKTRMNQVSSEYGLGYYVSQKAGKWFVSFAPTHKDPVPFYDGMEFSRY